MSENENEIKNEFENLKMQETCNAEGESRIGHFDGQNHGQGQETFALEVLPSHELEVLPSHELEDSAGWQDTAGSNELKSHFEFEKKPSLHDTFVHNDFHDAWNETPFQQPISSPLGLGLTSLPPIALQPINDAKDDDTYQKSHTLPPSNPIAIPENNTRRMAADAESGNTKLSLSQKSLNENMPSSPRKSTDSKGSNLSLHQRKSLNNDTKSSPIFSPFHHINKRTSSSGGAPTNSQSTPSKSQTLSQIQNVFNDSQKIAYVGLCYLSSYTFKKSRFSSDKVKKGAESFDAWSERFMEKLYVYLDLLPQERVMIKNLAEHGLVPSDLSTSLIQDAKTAQAEYEASRTLNSDASPSTPPMDIRYTILSHLFLLSVCDGVYDARSRSMLRTVAENLEIPYLEVIRLENCISNELRVYDEEQQITHDESVVGERNTKEGKGRWLYASLGVLAGGALIGVTAGLAAPFIGAGIGAALTTFGVTQGAMVGGFMASTGGIALITGGGVLTGGGMSGKAIVKRTRGIEEFEFLSLEEAMKKINEARESRRIKRLQSIKKDAVIKEQELQKELNSHLRSDSNLKGQPVSARLPDSSSPDTANINSSMDLIFSVPDAEEDDERAGTEANAEKTLEHWAGTGGNGEDDELAPPLISPLISQQGDTAAAANEKNKQTHVLITVSGWVAYDKDDHTFPFSTLEPGLNGDQYTLIWETKALQELGSTMSILASEIASFIFQQGLQATVLPVLMGALTAPMWLMKLTYLVDNPWGNALSKAEKAGRLLADTLMAQVQSNRPVTLVGFSIGARLVYYCLLELAAQGGYGIIDTVYLFGTPCVSSKKEWEAISSVVSGKIHNCYNPNDTLLAVCYRTSIASFKDVPGLSSMDGISGLENYDVSDVVQGHMEYVTKLPILLKNMGFEINSEEVLDQDAEQAHWKAELEEEKKKNKEKKEHERQLHIEKMKQDREAEEEKKRLAAEAEAERKRLAKEAAIAEKKRQELKKQLELEAQNRTGPVSASSTPAAKKLTLEQIAAEELREMAEMEKMMHQYWEPREISSTLPPLVINSQDKLEKGKEIELPIVFDEQQSPTEAVHHPEEELSDF